MDKTQLWKRGTRAIWLRVGGDYFIGHSHIKYRFVKVTNKGYNFLNLATSKCLLKSHVYGINNKQGWYWVRLQKEVAEVYPQRILKSFNEWLNQK